MKTKTLLFTAALGLLSAASSFAQVYSVNAVGYVNKSFAVPGYAIFGNPLNNGNNAIGTVFPNVPDGSIVSRFDNVTQDYKQPVSFQGGAWLDSDFNPATDVLNPGEGFFFYSPSATTITFVGDVPQGNLSLPLVAQYNLISSQVPQSASFAALGLDAISSDGDIAQFWIQGVGEDFAPPVAFNSAIPGWTDPDFNTVVPTPEVAEGWFLYRGSAGSWNRTFSVNP